MDLQELYAMGAFVPGKPVQRTINVSRPVTVPFPEWKDPKAPEFTGEQEDCTIDVWIKRPSSADEIAMVSADAEKQVYIGIIRLVRNEDGTPLFQSIEQVETLASWLLVPLSEAIKEVAARSPKGNSATTMPSGSNSPDGSEADPRKSGKKRSAQNGETS